MAEKSAETVDTNIDMSQQDLANVQKKRMLLSEVYVHKMRKVNTEPGNDEEFEVFHIFEFADDPNTKITPRLSTNCTEPRKIIDVLQNSTGSDTPQLQRLIEKLCTQNKKFTENQQTQANKTTQDNEPVVNNTASIPQTAPAVETPAPNMNFPVCAAVPNITSIPIIPKIEPIQSASPAFIEPTPNVIQNEPDLVESPVVPARPTTWPTIRVKAVESMQEKTKTPTVNQPSSVNANPQNRSMNNQNTPIIRMVSKPPQHAVAKKRVTVTQVIQPPTLSGDSQKAKPVVEANKQPVKLWNNVIQKEATSEPLEIRFSVTNYEKNEDGSTPPSDRQNGPLPVKHAREKRFQSFFMKRYGPSNDTPRTSLPVLDNASRAISSDHLSSLPTNIRRNQVVLAAPNRTAPQPPQPPQPIVSNAKDGSTLKIDQVFAGVGADFGLPTTPSPMECSSPLFDNLIKEVENEKITDENGTAVRIIPSADDTCSDYRCNICLMYNNSLLTYKAHMARIHSLRWVCATCHAGFPDQLEYYRHLNGKSTCKRSPNANRAFICIVDPPIILMKNQKVFAFRCKHCKDVAFQNQRNYVQHSQRHAQLFRCKKCPTKPLSIELMRQHLTHHTK